jgi:nucleoside-diphosphate-sugar epimerase
MRIFMTGATGYIGGEVAAALRRNGHEVAALVRPESEAGPLRDEGVVIVAGDLDSLPSLADTLGEYDTLVHTAQARSNTVALDRTAVDVFTAQKKAHVVYTSGVWVLGNTKDADESTLVNPLALVAWRPLHEQLVLDAGANAVLRPGCVYGGKQSLLAGWFSAADQGQPIEIIGDGRNHWAMVNLHDLADAYVRAIEQRASGVLHAIDDTHDTLEEMARAVAPDGEIRPIPADAVREKLGPFTDALIVDQIIDSKATRAKVGWNPQRAFKSSLDEQWREWRG